MDDFSYASGSSRKRPRSVSPMPMGREFSSSTAPPEAPESAGRLAKMLMDPKYRNEALNELLQRTSSHERSYVLDEKDDVLQSLAEIFFELLEWPASNDNDDDNDRPTNSQAPLHVSSDTVWTKAVTPESQKWADHCTYRLGAKGPKENFKVLEAVLVILRNLSFVATNHRMMAYSADTMTVLVGAMYETTSQNVGANDEKAFDASATSVLAVHAVHALFNLAPYLDVTGQRLLCDKLFLVQSGASSEDTPRVPDPSSFGQIADGKFGFGGLWLAKRLDTKEDLVSDVPPEIMLELTRPYLLSIWAIFPALTKILTDPTAPRLLVLWTEDLIHEFISQARMGPLGPLEDEQDASMFATIRSIMVHMPDPVLQRLAELLYIPRLGSDSLEYADPCICIVTRVNTLRLMMGYDATVDTDLRDRALDVLVPLLELDSPAMATRLCKSTTSRRTGISGIQTPLLDALVPILTSQAGRTEAPSLAAQLLRELSKAPSNRIAWIYLRERLVGLAGKDAKIAHWMLNLLPAPPMTSQEAEEEETEAPAVEA